MGKRFSCALLCMAMLLSSVVLISSTASPARAAAGEAGQTVNVGYIPIGDCLQLYVADEMGFFKEEGIKVEKRAMKGGAVIAPALESGEIQVGWSNAISIIVAHSKGFDLQFLTSGALEKEGTNRVHSLLVAVDSPVQKFTDLEGKKVAVNTLGNINELSMIAHMDRNGMDVKSVRLLEVPFPDMETALKNGSVDAILAVEPHVTLSVSHGTARYLDKSVHGIFGDQIMVGSWFAKKAWIDKNPELAGAFARAVNKASDYISRQPEIVPRILAKHTKLSEDLIPQIVLPAFSSTFEKEDLQRMIDMSAKYKFIKESFKAEEIMAQTVGK